MANKLTDEFIRKFQKTKNIDIQGMRKNYRGTHIYMNGKKIGEIDKLSVYRNVHVVYLHCNSIENIQNLTCLKNLTCLYLQWNRISSISNFNDLPNLNKLYLGHNSIKTVSGLKGMPSLQILHIQQQKLKEADSLSLDPSTVEAVRTSLTDLNICGNNITSPASLQPLHELLNLDISNNLISSLSDVCKTLQTLKKLKTLNIVGNPIVKNVNYKGEMIASSENLCTINDTPVSHSTRVFLHTFKDIKWKREKLKEKQRRAQFSSETRSYIHQLPVEFREIVSRSVIHNRKHTQKNTY